MLSQLMPQIVKILVANSSTSKFCVIQKKYSSTQYSESDVKSRSQLSRGNL
jgi:hypothetical protein